MELLILYLVLFTIFATINLKNVDESISSTKVILASMFQPLLLPIKSFNLILPFFGIYLQLDVAIIPSRKEMEEMTDKEAEKLSDTFKKIKEDLDKLDD